MEHGTISLPALTGTEQRSTAARSSIRLQKRSLFRMSRSCLCHLTHHDTSFSLCGLAHISTYCSFCALTHFSTYCFLGGLTNFNRSNPLSEAQRGDCFAHMIVDGSDLDDHQSFAVATLKKQIIR